MEQLKSRIEAVLFVTAKVLQVNEIAEILEEQPEAVEEALLELIMIMLPEKVHWKLTMKTGIFCRLNKNTLI
jgi:hypothetical protein